MPTFAADYQGVPTSVGWDDTLSPDPDNAGVGMDSRLNQHVFPLYIIFLIKGTIKYEKIFFSDDSASVRSEW